MGCNASLNDFAAKKQQILDRVDILALVGEHVSLKRRGKRWVGLCAFHSEKTPSFTVTPELGLFKCFGCGKGGDVFSFVQHRENVSFMEAMHILADRAGIELGSVQERSAPGTSRADLAKVNAWAVKFFRTNLLDERGGHAARAYLASRGMSEAVAERFHLGLASEGAPSLRAAAARAGISDRQLKAADLIRPGERADFYDTFRSRIIFPIRDATGRVVGFGGRTLVDDRAKYLNTRQNELFDKGRGLYGIDLAREAIAKGRRAVLVEGYTDCIAAHQAGFVETVATLGTAMTEAQVDLLRRYGDEIVLLFDSDEAGEAAADRAISVALPRCVRVRLARIPDGKDPGDFLPRAGAEAFSDVLKRSVDALEFKWSQTLQRFGGDGSDASRREAVVTFLRVVGEACRTGAVDVIQRGLLVNQVAHLLRMDGREVDRLMFRLQVPQTVPRVEPAKGAGGRSSPPPDGVQTAWTHWLEVVLNEPGVLPTGGALPDRSWIRDGRDRRIAGAVFELAESVGGFRLADVLARLNDPGDVDRLTELVEEGRKRGNYEATFRLALERIRGASVSQEVDQSKRLLQVTQGEEGSPEVARTHLAHIHQRMKERRHYVPRRMIPPSNGDMGVDPTETTNPTPTMEQR